MPLLRRVVKPKTRKGKRFLESRLPKLVEDEKTAIFIRGVNANNVVLQAMKDLAVFKKPQSVFFNRKNDIKPFEDCSSIEFFSEKNNASLFAFGSNNKKRPNNLIMGRMFDHHLLDMFEFRVENFKSLKDFKNSKFVSGSKPLVVFSGDQFETNEDYQRLKNFLMDFFCGTAAENLNLKGIDHLLVFTEVGSKIHFRSYRVILNKSATKTPEVDVEEIGPHMDMTLRRTKLASSDLFKQSCRKPLQLKPRKKKNVARDTFGTTQGRIHMQRQDYSKLQTRKMKGLKVKKNRNTELNAKRKQPESSASEPVKKRVKTE